MITDRGNCSGNGVCNCTEEWIGDKCDIPCLNGTNINGVCVCDHTCLTGVSCHVQCGGNGVCDDAGQCVCDFDKGFKGAQCHVKGCPGFPLNCMGHGSCNTGTTPGQCECDPGWKQPACAEGICQDDCNNNTMATCEEPPEGGMPRCLNCAKPYMGDWCELSCDHGNSTRDADGNWDCICDNCYSGAGCADLCNGRGTCQDDGKCDCGNDGYRGDNCQLRGCPGVGQDCSGHGSCKGKYISAHKDCFIVSK